MCTSKTTAGRPGRSRRNRAIDPPATFSGAALLQTHASAATRFSCLRSPSLSPSRTCIIHPLGAPACGVDITHALTRAIAEELWKADGGDDLLNWLEAQMILQDILLAADRGRAVSRSLELPEGIDRNKATAEFNSGALTIRALRLEAAKPRSVLVIDRTTSKPARRVPVGAG